MAGSGNKSELTFSVRDWFAWTPGRETRRAWREWASAPATPVEGSAEEPEMPTLPMMLRRRATAVGQKAVGAALACQDVGAARYVIASRHGEYARTTSIFTSLAERTPLSPADFSMSVHHGLAGLLSIHTGNRLGHVAVAAAEDSFANGFVEAALCVAEEPETPVLLIYYDAPLPDGYEEFRSEAESELPMVLAVLLGPGGAERIAYRWQAAQASAVVQHQPLIFLRWLLSGTPDAECQGERMVWRWSRVH